MTAKSDLRTTDTKERIIKEAQRLYHEGGYNHMALDKISGTLNVTRPALYHHFPGGKEQLFREMIEHLIDQRVKELSASIQKGTSTREKFENMIWTIINNPMMDIRRMLANEMAEFQEETKALLWQKLAQLRGLVMGVMESAVEKGEFRAQNLNLVFFSFLTLCDMCEHLIHSQEHFSQMKDFVSEDKESIIKVLLDNWLNGVTVRSI
jgi:TetR/AcrR family transcriptional regulator, cholesterol catabolism regulator